MSLASDPLRVAVNASILGERPTGLGVYTLNLTRELSRLLPDTVVYTSFPEAVSAGLRGVRRVAAIVRPERRMAGHALRMAWLQAVLPLRLRRERVDLLLNTVPEGCLSRRIPQVTVVHDLLPLRYPEEYPRQQYYFRLLVPRVLRASRLVIADSDNTRRDILAAYGLAPGKIRVVPAGYDDEAFRPEATESGGRGDGLPYVLFVGNLLPHKNLLRLLDAFALVARRMRCRLVIRGEGHPRYVEEVRERIGTLEARALVEIQSYASAQRLGDLYRNARCLVLPSLYEGFGLTALEAMASGTPVIASNRSSLPEVVGDAGLLVDPTDTVELADALYKVLTSDVLREELRARGLCRAKLFSWRRTAQEVLAVLEEAARMTDGPTPDERP